MRRSFALVALATTTWSNVAALHCAAGGREHPLTLAASAPHAEHAALRAARPGAHRPVASAEGASAGRNEASSLAHRHAGRGGQAPSGAHEPDGYGDDGCRRVMTCGTPMIRPVAPRTALRVAAPSAPAHGPLSRARSATPPAADPPPPRRFA